MSPCFSRYKCAYDIQFQQGIVTGDKRAIHPIVHWILANLDPLKERAYLAQYCVTLEARARLRRDFQ